MAGTAAYPGYGLPGLMLPGSTDAGGDVTAVPVTNTLVKPNGDPDVGLTVYGQLVSSSPWLPDGREIANWATAVTDDTGTWTMDLYPTGDYAATGAYYRIREGANTWTISVTTGGPIHDQLMAP